ncbi:hypothetical protein CVS40_11927 [Lucilia cuprina]|nr:hypothetical protein CVS40_11927 [Lucilia cuprina]
MLAFQGLKIYIVSLKFIFYINIDYEVYFSFVLINNSIFLTDTNSLKFRSKLKTKSVQNHCFVNFAL